MLLTLYLSITSGGINGVSHVLVGIPALFSSDETDIIRNASGSDM